MTSWQKFPLYLLLSCSMLPIASCDSEQEVAQKQAAHDRQSFGSPELVGNLPDGRPIYVIERYIVGDHNHFIYFVPDGGVTLNRTVSQGKTTVNDTQFMAPDLEQDPSVVQAKQKVMAKARLDQATKNLEEAKKNAQEAGVSQ